MVKLSLTDANPPLDTVLCLAAHCDDIEIGCGATLMKIADMIPEAIFHVVVFSSNNERALELRSSLGELLSNSRLILSIKEFRNGFFPYVGVQIKEYFEQIKQSLNPGLIFTHCGRDKHQDHKLISDLTWNTFRNHMILEFEIPKYDADLASPNCFVTVEPEYARRKTEILLKHYPSQRDKQWFSEDTFMALLRLRGIECNSPTGLAEAFYSRKMLIL